MPTYAGINGVVRKLKEWPVGVAGVVRQQKEVWAGVDGVKKKIFSKGITVKIFGNAFDAFNLITCSARINIGIPGDGRFYSYPDAGGVNPLPATVEVLPANSIYVTVNYGSGAYSLAKIYHDGEQVKVNDNGYTKEYRFNAKSNVEIEFDVGSYAGSIYGVANITGGK